MFSLWTRLSHRLRLTLVFGSTTAVLLGIVCLCAILFVREQSLARRFGELESGLARLLKEPGSVDQLSEVREDLPGSEVAIFEASGRPVSSTAKRAIPLTLGRYKDKDVIRVGVRAGDRTIVIESSWAETEIGIRQLASVLGLMWLIVVAISSAIAWSASGRVLRPVQELIASAESLSAQPGQGLLETSDSAEYDVLAKSLNRMVDGVRHSAAIQEQFASDAAHELRTPLALLRLKLETSLQKARKPEEYIASQAAMLIQVERLSSLVESLLESAKQDQLSLEPTPLHEVTSRYVAKWCEQSGWPMEQLVLAASPQFVNANSNAVEIILRNLLDNAAAHADPGSAITVEVSRRPDGPYFAVENVGTPIPEESRSKVFERFYRADNARDRAGGGSGIGLAVVQRLSSQMNALASFESDGQVNRFVVRFNLFVRS